MKFIRADGSEQQETILPRLVSRMIKLAKTIPDDEGWTTQKMADALDYGVQGMQGQTAHPALKKYRVKMGTYVYWGNEKTIKKELNKQKTSRNEES